jgi:ubiquinone/menaquinone biosynthesis C-methylase UbiE
MVNKEILDNERKFYDAISEKKNINYNELKRMLSFDAPSYYAAKIPRLKQTLNQSIGCLRGKKVLVYGCGNDCAALWFSISGSNVDAIDISPKSIENQNIIADTLNLKIRSMVMDAHNLDLPSNEYDIVYGNAILHHLELKKAIPEIYRILKPGGTAIFRDVMSGNVFIRAFRYATPFWRTPNEHPLKSGDFVLFSKEFKKIITDHYILSGLPYFFFARMMNNILLKKARSKRRIPLHVSIYNYFDRLDEKLFALNPNLKKQAWICLLIATK